MLTFPSLIGVSYATGKSIENDVIIQRAMSGQEIRVSNYSQGRYKWRLPYGYLPNPDVVGDPNTGGNFPVSFPYNSQDLQTLMGFYELMQGPTTPFLFLDPTDYTTSPNHSSPTPSQIGIGDGVTTTFQLARVWNGMPHLIYAPTSSTAYGAPKIYVNGVLKTVSTDYTISSTGLVTFTSPPGGGLPVTADFAYLFVVRFEAMENEWLNEAGPFWTTKEIALVEVVGGI